MFIDTSLRPQGEQVDAIAPTKLKLSQAMRIGARLRPQCAGSYLHAGKSCALGAALEAFGITEATWTREDHERAIDYFSCRRVEAEITRRNDGGESRESIADWLESQGL